MQANSGQPLSVFNGHWRSQPMKLEKKEITMKMRHFLSLLLFSVLLSACGAVRSGGDVEQGRQALLAGNYQAALGSFQNAEQADPNYVYGTELREGVSSFLGRAQYLTGNYAQARQTLEKDLRQHPSDNLARMYYGLTLYRLGDQKAAETNIQRGMQGIYNWLEYLNTKFARLEARLRDGGTVRSRRRFSEDYHIVRRDRQVVENQKCDSIVYYDRKVTFACLPN